METVLSEKCPSADGLHVSITEDDSSNLGGETMTAALFPREKSPSVPLFITALLITRPIMRRRPMTFKRPVWE